MTVTLHPNAADPDAVVDTLAASLQDGGVVIVPTDTVYAVIADAFSPDGVAVLRRLRGMGPNDPLSVFVRSPKQLPGITAEVPPEAERLIAAFWPGPLTIVLPAATTMQWDIGRTDGTVAVRMPLQEVVIDLARRVGPLVASSAAPVGQPAPTDAEAAIAALGDEVAAVLDDGPLPGSARSTVVDLTRAVGEVLRDGPIPADLVTAVAIGEVDPIEAGERLLEATEPRDDETRPPAEGSGATDG